MDTSLTEPTNETNPEISVAPETHRPEDIAAAFFKKEKPRLRGLLMNMSAKQIRRFVMHVAAFPMHDAGDNPKTDAERRAAYLFNEMVTNKTLMILSLEMQKVDEAQKAEGENNG